MSAMMSEKEVAKYLNVSVRTVQAWRGDGLGPRFVKLYQNVRYRQEDLEAFVSERLCNKTRTVNLNIDKYEPVRIKIVSERNKV